MSTKISARFHLLNETRFWNIEGKDWSHLSSELNTEMRKILAKYFTSYNGNPVAYSELILDKKADDGGRKLGLNVFLGEDDSAHRSDVTRQRD